VHVMLAIAAAALYALSAPLSKLLLASLSPTMLAGLLYAGAGIGMGAVALLRGKKKEDERRFGRRDIRYLVLMIVLDVAAPILLLFGLLTTPAANVSLLNNFEIVATSLFALFVFREAISRRLWIGIAAIVAASALLSFTAEGSLSFSPGSLLVLGAATCWGFENNCTRKLSNRDPLKVVIVKGLCSGTVALAIAALTGAFSTDLPHILAALAVGAVVYGLSIRCYVAAQSRLGAAKTSAYYAVAPFIGALLSVAIFRELPGTVFYVALAALAVGAWFTSTESRKSAKKGTP